MACSSAVDPTTGAAAAPKNDGLGENGLGETTGNLAGSSEVCGSTTVRRRGVVGPSVAGARSVHAGAPSAARPPL